MENLEIYHSELRVLSYALRQKNQKVISIESFDQEYIDAVLAVFSLTLDELRSGSKKDEYVSARRLIFHHLRNKSRFTVKKIGEFFNKNHATVIHSLRKYSDLKESADKQLLYQEQQVQLMYNQILNGSI